MTSGATAGRALGAVREFMRVESAGGALLFAAAVLALSLANSPLSGLYERLLMVPAAMSASCAFMLPVATAPNVIVFSTGRVPPPRMAREGFALNLIGAVAISLVCFFLIT